MAAEPVPVPPGLRRVRATRYVSALREGGSLPGLVEADDDGLYVVKFTGAGQGRPALVAEVVAGELARELGLPVPELVVADVDPRIAHAEPDQEVQDLLAASAGPNLGLDFLPGALPFSPAVAAADPRRAPDPTLAARVVWLDALVTNVDRTARNPNLLEWGGRLWLIDHGAALYVHHSWDTAGFDLERHARQPYRSLPDHVLLPFAGPLHDADAALAPQVDRALLERVVDRVPPVWAGARPVRTYVDYLLARLQPPRPFLAVP